jgi:cell division protein FtsW (lipid II flippase)
MRTAAITRPASPLASARGSGLARLWWKLAIATNWPILVAVIVLSGLGVISIWADTRNDLRPEWPKQIGFLVAAILCMAAFQAVNYQKIGRFAWPFYVFSLLLIGYCVLGTKIPGLPLVRPIKGQCNWINFGPVSLQPSELMKVSFVLVMARYLRFRSSFRTVRGLLGPFALAAVPMAFILKQPDLGTALVFIPCLFAMLYVAGAKLRHLFAIFGIGAALGALLWLSGTDRPVFRHLPDVIRPYQRARVYAMFSSDPRTLQQTGFQQHNALIAFGSGGVSGKGAGAIPVGRRVPEAHNDMIFALIGEQFGFFGAAVVLGAYIVLFTAGIEIAGSTREPFGRLVALGIVALLAGQTFLNLMVAIRLMPVTGVTLPFMSYGGSSLVASFMSAGLLLNIGQNRPVVMANDSFEFSE